MRKLKKYVPTKFMAEDSIYDKEAADFVVDFISRLIHITIRAIKKRYTHCDCSDVKVLTVYHVNGFCHFLSVDHSKSLLYILCIDSKMLSN